MAKLSLQWEKKHERKAKASSSSSFLPVMPVPLRQLPFLAGSDVVTTTLSLSVCAVTYSASAPVVATAPFVAMVDVTPVEPDCEWCHVVLPEERAKMLAAFEDLWAARKRSSHPGPSSAPSLVTPPVPPLAVLAPHSIGCSSGCRCCCVFRHSIFPLGCVFSLFSL